MGFAYCCGGPIATDQARHETTGRGLGRHSAETWETDALPTPATRRISNPHRCIAAASGPTSGRRARARGRKSAMEQRSRELQEGNVKLLKEPLVFQCGVSNPEVQHTCMLASAACRCGRIHPRCIFQGGWVRDSFSRCRLFPSKLPRASTCSALGMP